MDSSPGFIGPVFNNPSLVLQWTVLPRPYLLYFCYFRVDPFIRYVLFSSLLTFSLARVGSLFISEYLSSFQGTGNTRCLVELIRY